MSDTELQDLAYALARQLGHGVPEAKRIVGESLFALNTTTSIDQIKKSKRKSYETKRRELNADVKRREYNRRRPYRYQRIFFNISLRYEAEQETSDLASVTKVTLQRRHLKHLVHAGRTGRTLATTLGCLAYRHSPSAVKYLYERLEDAVYQGGGLLDVVKRIRSRTSGRAKPRKRVDPQEVVDNRKKNSTADYRNTKGAAIREAIERFRHLSEARLELGDMIDPISFVARINTRSRPCDAYLSDRIREVDPRLLLNFDGSVVHVARLRSIINSILETDCSQMVEAFKVVDRNKGKLWIEGVVHHRYRNRRLIESAYQDCIAPQRQVIQTQLQGREKNLDYDDECLGTTVGAAELLRALAPWGSGQENGVRQALKEVVGKTVSRVGHPFSRPKYKLDKRDDLEAEINYSLIHPDIYRSHWEKYKQYEVIDRTYDIPSPRISVPQIYCEINREGMQPMRDREPPNDYQGNAPDVLTHQDREDINRWVSEQLTRRNRVDTENLTITVDGVKHGELQLNPKADSESFYNLELESGAEIIQTWARDEAGEILLSTFILDYRTDTTLVESEKHSFNFDIFYDGNYKIKITHRYRNQEPEWSVLPATVPARTRVLTPAWVGVIAGISVSALIGFAVWSYWGSRTTHSDHKVTSVESPQPSASFESGSALPSTAKSDGTPANVETTDKTKSSTVRPTPWPNNEKFVQFELVDGPIRVLKGGGVRGLNNYSAEMRQVILSAVNMRRVMVSIGTGSSEEDVKMGLDDQPKEIQLLTPRHGVVVADPTFSWVGWATDRRYVVSVYDEELSHEVPIAREVISDASVWVPSVKLPLGRRFTWQVEAFGREFLGSRDAQIGKNRLEMFPSTPLGNRRKQSAPIAEQEVMFTTAGLLSDTPLGPSKYSHTDLNQEDTATTPISVSSVGRFETPSYSVIKQLEAAKVARDKSHLVLGLLYLKVGRLNEAAQEFQVMVKRNPHSRLAHELLASVRKQIGWSDGVTMLDKEAR